MLLHSGQRQPFTNLKESGILYEYTFSTDMTLARVLLEIRRRAQRAPHDVPRLSAMEAAAREVLQIPKEDHFDARVLDGLTPESVLRIDMLIGECGVEERMRMIRASLSSGGG